MIYDASSVALVRQGGRRHAEGTLHFPRTNRASRPVRERFENKTHIDAGRRDEAARGAFLSSTERANPGSRSSSSSSTSSSFSLIHLLSSSSYSTSSFFARPRRLHDEAEVDEGRRARAAAQERETIPVEEGPFCPAHPTRGFRRPWSH